VGRGRKASVANSFQKSLNVFSEGAHQNTTRHCLSNKIAIIDVKIQQKFALCPCAGFVFVAMQHVALAEGGTEGRKGRSRVAGQCNISALIIVQRGMDAP
jgi:hypothetical protein